MHLMIGVQNLHKDLLKGKALIGPVAVSLHWVFEQGAGGGHFV